MRKRKTRRSRRHTPSGPTNVEIKGLPPLGAQRAQGIPPKKGYKADSRRDFQNLYDSLLNRREQFSAWFEEAAMAKIEIETKEIRDCVADIKKDQKRYWQIIKQLPNVEEISEEELEKQIGKADQLLTLAKEISSMETFLPHKIDKLYSLLRQPLQ